MLQISRHLSKSEQQRGRGPGAPTALAVHSKYTAVGTAKGLVLLFDHMQAVFNVLGVAAAASAAAAASSSTAADSNSSASSSAEAITALDMCAAADYLIAGSASGRITLWDYVKGVVLKTVLDAHACAVTAGTFVTGSNLLQSSCFKCKVYSICDSPFMSS
jgi:uncharacterized membrane protein